MKPFALASLAGASCLLATYGLTREGSITFALTIVVVIGAVGAIIALALFGENKPRIVLLISAFIIGALISEVVAFTHYYITYGSQDPKLVVGVAVSILEFGIISTVGGLTMFVAASVKRRITLRSSGTAQKRAAP
ncbi:MAG: hypothetical protein V4443_09130 [Pseudomonadota bacterium]